MDCFTYPVYQDQPVDKGVWIIKVLYIKYLAIAWGGGGGEKDVRENPLIPSQNVSLMLP